MQSHSKHANSKNRGEVGAEEKRPPPTKEVDRNKKVGPYRMLPLQRAAPNESAHSTTFYRAQKRATNPDRPPDPPRVVHCGSRATGDLQQCMLAANDHDQSHRQHVWTVPGMGWLVPYPDTAKLLTCIEQVHSRNRGQPILFDHEQNPH